MSFPSFTTRYRFIYALSLLQVVAGFATVWLYGLVGGVAATIIQLSPPVYALCTVAMIHRMLPYTTRRTDPATTFSRVDMHYYNLIYTLFMWGLCRELFTFFLQSILSPAAIHPSQPSLRPLVVNTRNLYGLPKYEPASKALALCTQSAPSMDSDSWKCVPVGMDAVLPIAIVVAVFSTCRTLKHHAIAFYGTELVAAPPLESASDSTAEAKPIPAWMAVQVADVAREGGEARDSVVLLPMFK
ncbi:hypothetical protein C8R46DRAFT_1351168 [Mycena filopes]|nr:hypothetical protein C8R46DRAFT_1351168 [Mycena filopes]